MRALLDGDIYAFRSAAASENDDLNIAIWRLEEMIDNTLAEVGSDEFSIFLSGGNNFRYDIYPEYKANRADEKPRHLADLKQYLIEKYQAQVSDGCEADDLLGIEQCAALQLRGDMPGRLDCDVNPLAPLTIICSLDKDLRMIPGNHYSFEISGKITKGPNAGKVWTKPMEKVFVEPFQGLYNFYYQLLIGDSTDNIKGAQGIGKVKASRILADCTTEQELFEAVEPHFSCEEELLMTGQCLWIFRKPNDRWRIPTFETSISKS
jgi:5'-3' exonuclease